MCRRSGVAAVIALALASSLTAVFPAAARTSKESAGHKLIVAVAKNLPSTAEKKLAILVLITQNGGPPSAAVATASRPLTVFLDNRGLFRVKTEIDSSCKGICAASYRISGAANHKLEVIPSCRPKSSGFVCSKIKIVRVY